jgi:predicted nucleotidyltransferase
LAASRVNSLEAALRRIAGELAATKRNWALVGGLAVSARAEPRTTRDVDVVVGVEDDADAERLVLLLQAKGFRVLVALEQQAVNRLATVRVVSPGSSEQGVVVDLLFASSGIERDIASRAENLEILPGLVVPVARISDLMALKVLARDDRRRPQDLDDLRALLREAQEADIADTERALQDIEARGYHRDRRLLELFDVCRKEEQH